MDLFFDRGTAKLVQSTDGEPVLIELPERRKGAMVQRQDRRMIIQTSTPYRSHRLVRGVRKIGQVVGEQVETLGDLEPCREESGRL